MKWRYYISILICGILSFQVFCQENERHDINKHSFGFNIGTSSGIGFSYRYMSDKFGFQFSSIPVLTQEQILYVFQGLEFDYVYKNKERSDHFVYVANALLFSREHISYSYPQGPDQIINHVDYIRYGLFHGTGIGWGLRIRGKWKLDKTFRIGAMMSNIDGDTRLLPSIGFGLHYRL